MENINIKNNIILIGMMGSWKSTVGKKLSKNLSMKFVDTDDLICDVTKLNMTEIFKEYGNRSFQSKSSFISH